LQLIENIALAVNGLRSNKMRALLTMLGIIIGIGSVLAIVTVGDSMTASVTSVMNDMGANSIQLGLVNRPDENGEYRGNVSGSGSRISDEDLITDEMVLRYREAFAGQIQAIALTDYTGSGQAKNGRNRAVCDVQGLNADAFGTVNLDLIAGHFLNDREVEGAKNVAVISDKFIEKLFPGLSPQDALGREIKVQMGDEIETFAVTGVYKYEISGMMQAMTGDVSTNVYIPLPVSLKITGNPEGYSYMQIKAADGVNLEQFRERSKAFFARFYRSNLNYDIEAYSMDSMIGQLTGMLGTMSIAIGIIAGISLLVGGIGVMNIMLVSVTERTREIGTRKALGAKNSAIRIQFIVESMIICLIGGAIGVALGTGLGRLGSTLLGFPGWPSISIVIIAVCFSMAIGVFFGYYPANKAAKLDPIEALRYE
jgi:putative ABC transport system permease protein